MTKKEMVNSDNIDSYLFLDYIKSYGFDENNYNKILELFQTPKKSISQFLDVDTFLLTPSLKDCNEFKEACIKGGIGYLTKKEIRIPKTYKNDEILLRHKTLSKENKVLYSIPTISDFGCIVGNGTSKDIDKISSFDLDQYIGFCMDSGSKKTELLLSQYKKIYKALKENDNRYTLEYDTLYNERKQLCLIKRK